MIFLGIGIIFGFYTAKFFAGKKEGKPGRINSIKFKIKEWTVHMHHWIISLTLLIVAVIFKIHIYFIYGLLTGMVIRGLTYRDFYKFVYKTKK